MATQNIYVTRDDRATVACPNCGLSRTGKVTKFKNRRAPVKVKCPCDSVFDVFFERRREDRKEAHLDGHYGKLPTYADWGKMVVKNLSSIGIGFTTITAHHLSAGDELRAIFAHPTTSHVDIDRNGVVRVADDNYIGFEFRNPVQLDDSPASQIRNYP